MVEKEISWQGRTAFYLIISQKQPSVRKKIHTLSVQSLISFTTRESRSSSAPSYVRGFYKLIVYKFASHFSSWFTQEVSLQIKGVAEKITEEKNRLERLNKDNIPVTGRLGDIFSPSSTKHGVGSMPALGKELWKSHVLLWSMYIYLQGG